MNSSLEEEGALEVEALSFAAQDPQSLCNSNSRIQDLKAYEYTIGDAAGEIPLTDLWAFETECCALTPKDPKIIA